MTVAWRSSARVACLLLPLLVCSAASAEAAVKTREKVYGEIVPDKALIYVVRPGSFFGKIRTSFVYVDDQFLGVVDNSSYTFGCLEPGRHLLWLSATRVRKEIDVAAGQEYFLLLLMAPPGGFHWVPKETGMAWIEKIKFHATPTEKELRTVEDHLENKYAKAERREAKQEKAPIYEVVARSEPDNTEGMLKVPGSTRVRLELMENVTSFVNRAGDVVWFRIAEDLSIEDTVWAVAGTPVKGLVRKRAKARRAGRGGGNVDVVVPAIPATDGSDLPLLGRVDTSGRPSRSAGALALAGGALVSAPVVLASLAIRAKEGFMLSGGQYDFFSREDHWVSVTQSGSAEVGSESTAPDAIELRAKAGGEAEFAPQRHQRPGPIEISVETASELTAVELFSVGGWKLPVPVTPTAERQTDGWRTLTFDGWDLVRFVQFREESMTVPLRLRGRVATGEPFVAETDLRVVVRLPKGR